MPEPLVDPVPPTARWAAASRARESVHPIALFVDPLAEDLATDAGRRPLDGADDENPFLPIRTRWLDDRIAAAVRDGVRQVVLVAAGLDARAYRLDWPDGTTVFEVDRPDLLAAKQATLDEVGAEPRCERRPVGADLAGPWLAALAGAGHRGDEATVWVVEGALVLLEPATAAAVLADAATASAAGSVLLADLLGDGFTRSPHTRDHLQALADQGIPWRFFVADPEAVLATAGWRAAVVDEPGSGTADYGRWPYPRIDFDDIPAAVRADLPRTYLVRAAVSSPSG